MAGIQTGHGATITFGTSGFTAAFTEISGFDQAREVLDTTQLSTTDYRTKTPGDLVDAGEFTATFFYDADEQPPITGAAETITITYPDSAPGAGGGATAAASGFVSSWSSPTLATDQLMSAELTITWADGPTWADET